MLWNHLAQVELLEAEWLIAGDFNNIENPQDKQGGYSRTSIDIWDLETWSKMLTRLGVCNSFNLEVFHPQNKQNLNLDECE